MGKSGVYKWSAIDRVGNAIMTFSGNLILARMLDPTDFGLLAMVAIFVAIAYNISSCGMADGIIHKLQPTDEDYSTAFTFNTTVGALLGCCFILSSHAVANLFGHQELIGIMIAIGICIFFQTMSFVQETRLRKELDMKKLAIVRLSATFTSLVLGIILVLCGFSYWGLVSTRIFLGFFQFLYYTIATKWLPKFKIYKESFKFLFGYGFNLMLAFIVGQCTKTINATILGKYAPASTAGLYSQAQKLEEVPFGITESVFNMPFFPVISNEPNADRQIDLARNMHHIILLVNITIGAFLISIAYPAIEILYGSKWIAAAPVFQILVVFGAITAIKYFYQTILKNMGRTSLIRNLNFIELLIQLGLLFFFYDKGVKLIACTQVIAVAAICLVHLAYYKSFTHAGIFEILKVFFQSGAPAIAALAVCAGIYATAVGSINVVLQALVLVGAFAITTAALVYIFDKRTYVLILNYLHTKKTKKE